MRPLGHAPEFTPTPLPAMLAPFEAASETHDDGDEQGLDRLISGIAEELAADGMMVAWHRDLQQPTLLFFDGECRQDVQAERDLIESATRTARAANQTDNAISGVSHHGSGDVVTATIPLRNTVVTISGLFRHLGAAGPAKCRAAMARLLPFVQPFFRLWIQRQDLTRRVRGLTAALDNSNVATFFLSCRGELLFANHAGRELLAQDTGLSGDGGQLTAATLTETLRLRAAIEHVCAADKADQGTTPVLALRRAKRRPLMMTLVPAEGDESDPLQRAAIAYVFDPDQDLTRLIEPACRMYGLSSGETRLACSLARGASLSEAADALGVKEQTARSYLKQVFLKTETNRQAELVGLMLKSAVRTSPRGQAQVF